jgi:hypothetical protein
MYGHSQYIATNCSEKTVALYEVLLYFKEVVFADKNKFSTGCVYFVINEQQQLILSGRKRTKLL